MKIKLNGHVRNLAGNGKPEKMIVFLHGVGSDGYDLIGLADYFAKLYPKAVYLSPNAPFKYDFFEFGYQWFSLTDYSEDVLFSGMMIAMPILEDYIEENLKQYNLQYKDIILVGFSQGTMMALQFAPRLAESCFAVIGFSGALIEVDELKPSIKSKPPICIIHGDKDEIVTINRFYDTVKWLKSLDLLKKEYEIKGLGHSINQVALDKALEFLHDLSEG